LTGNHFLAGNHFWRETIFWQETMAWKWQKNKGTGSNACTFQFFSNLHFEPQTHHDFFFQDDNNLHPQLLQQIRPGLVKQLDWMENNSAASNLHFQVKNNSWPRSCPTWIQKMFWQ
jgi:hypothetical protein